MEEVKKKGIHVYGDVKTRYEWILYVRCILVYCSMQSARSVTFCLTLSCFLKADVPPHRGLIYIQI